MRYYEEAAQWGRRGMMMKKGMWEEIPGLLEAETGAVGFHFLTFYSAALTNSRSAGGSQEEGYLEGGKPDEERLAELAGRRRLRRR